MEKASKIKTFKGTLSSIELFLKLLEANVKYEVKVSQNKNSYYYKIIQSALGFSRIEYHVEYDYGVIRLDIHCTKETGLSIKDDVYRILKPSSKISVEQFKRHVTFTSYFKFEDVNKVNSIAELMIEINKE